MSGVAWRDVGQRAIAPGVRVKHRSTSFIRGAIVGRCGSSLAPTLWALAQSAMRSLEREHDAILRRELGCRAAWLPVTSQVEIGDHGVISRGAFNRVGNVASDFGVKLATSSGEPGRLNFVSQSARVVRFAGGAQVPAFTAGAPVAAEAAATARAHGRALGDPTWLAYAMYAAPARRLSITPRGEA